MEVNKEDEHMRMSEVNMKTDAIYSELAMASQFASVICTLAETRRQAEEGASFIVVWPNWRLLAWGSWRWAN